MHSLYINPYSLYTRTAMPRYMYAGTAIEETIMLRLGSRPPQNSKQRATHVQHRPFLVQRRSLQRITKHEILSSEQRAFDPLDLMRQFVMVANSSRLQYLSAVYNSKQLRSSFTAESAVAYKPTHAPLVKC